MTRLLIALLFVTAASSISAASKAGASFTTIEDAKKHNPHVELIGEYRAKDGKSALQATLLKDGTFLIARYAGGLPGAGWNGSKIESSTLAANQLKDLLGAYKRVERGSPTMGAPAPEGAIISFPEGLTNIKDGIMWAGAKTTKPLGSFHLHVEFKLPLHPERNPSYQNRANSGLYIFNNYEVQVIDTFALDLHAANNAIEVESKASQWCGSLYKMKTPDTNMAFPPLRWQTYDIDFKAPVFDGENKVKNARITVRHNGVLIHDDVELKTGTGAGAKRPQLAEGSIFFQAHGSPVMYRNVWATEL